MGAKSNPHDDQDWCRVMAGRGRQKGCYVYIPRNALDLSLIAPPSEKCPESHPGPIVDMPLFYKIVPWGKNRVIVAFRRET